MISPYFHISKRVSLHPTNFEQGEYSALDSEVLKLNNLLRQLPSKIDTRDRIHHLCHQSSPQLLPTLPKCYKQTVNKTQQDELLSSTIYAILPNPNKPKSYFHRKNPPDHKISATPFLLQKTTKFIRGKQSLLPAMKRTTYIPPKDPPYRSRDDELYV